MAPAERKEDMRSLSIAQTDGFFFLWEGGGGCWGGVWLLGLGVDGKLPLHINRFVTLMSLHCSSSRMGRYMKLQEP